MTKKPLLPGRRAFLLGSGALIGMGASIAASRFRQFNGLEQVTYGAEKSFEIAGGAPLRERAAAKGLIYGAASTRHFMSSDTDFATRLSQECDMFVGGSDFLWHHIQPEPDRFEFSRGDWLVEYARTQGMLLVGTHLVWHHSLPKWVKAQVNRQNAEQILVKHIDGVARHYAGKIYGWTVVNEATDPRLKLNPSRRPDGLRNTLWLKSLGPDYIDLAFRTAAAADPQALLIYNDAGLDYSEPAQDARKASVLKLLEHLKSIGSPVHALGTQAHLSADKNNFSPQKLRRFLSDVASLGLKILITEMDVIGPSPPRDPAVRDRIVAGVYEDYLSAALDEPAVVAVSTWGFSDRYGRSNRWLPFDAELRPTLAYNAIARALEGASVREAQIKLPNRAALQQIPFQDIQGHWAQAYLRALAAKNIISGFPDGTFRPNSPVTRAEFAAIVTKAFTSKQQSSNAIAFQDVPRNFWGYNAIQIATKYGFLAGYPNEIFQPNQQIPRAQVLVALASGLKLSGTNTSILSFYQDASQIPSYAAGKVAAATQQKFVVNYPTVKLLNPNRKATRAEVAAFVYQALVSDGKAEPITSPYVVVTSS